MSLTYLVTFAELWAMTVCVAWTSVQLNRVFLPEWHGSVRVLAVVVSALGIVIVLSEALGTVGLFTRPALVLGAVSIAVVVRVVCGTRRPTPAARAEDARDTRLVRVAAAVVVSVMAVEWVSQTLSSLRGAAFEGDSLVYHLPNAVRFAQTGSLAGIHYNARDFGSAFGPLSPELCHAVGMVVLGRDTLSPWLNLGWLALALLAAWSIGARWKRPAASVMLIAAVLGIPMIVVQAAGQATNDIAVTALFLAAVALILQPHAGHPGEFVTALTCGLLLGTKFTALIPVGLLFVGALVIAGRKQAFRTAALWVVGLVPGAYWYLRLLVVRGSPVPDAHLGLGGWQLPSVEETPYGKLTATLARYLVDPASWRNYLWPQLRTEVHWEGILVLAGATAALALVAFSPWGDRRMRMASIIGLAVALSYPFTPGSGEGPAGMPVLFYQSVRFVVPALAVGLALVAGRLGRRALLAASVITPIVILAELARLLSSARGPHHRPLVEGLVLVALVWIAAAVSVRNTPRTMRYAGLLAVAGGAVLIPLAAGAEGRYVRGWYADADYVPAAAVYPWARTVHHARIGLLESFYDYPFVGADLTNTVQDIANEAPGRVLDQSPSCAAIESAIERYHYDYLVIAPPPDAPPGREEAAIGRSANVQLLTRRGHASVYAVVPHASPSCPPETTPG